MRAYSLIVILSLASGSNALASFSLEKDGDQICRVQAGKRQLCIPTLETTFASEFKEIDLLKKASDVNSSATHANAQRKLAAAVLKQYSILSVRDLAISPKGEFEKGSYAYFPFFASVRWANANFAVLNGTVFVEGYLRIPKDGDQTLIEVSNEPLEVQAVASEIAEIKSYEDSQTTVKLPSFRFVEKAARYLHFNVVGTDGLTIDGATQSLLKTLVAPMVYAEALDHFIDSRKQLEERNIQDLLDGPKKLLQEPLLKSQPNGLELK